MLAFQLVILFFTSLFITMFMTPLINKLVMSLGIMDFPDHTILGSGQARKVHKVPIPRLGGVAIVFGFFLGVLIVAPQQEITGIYLCSLLMFFTGLFDDIRQLSAKLRLVVQVSVAAFTVWVNNLVYYSIVFTPRYSLEIPYWLGFLLAVLVIVGAINSINMIDGLDGLASGIVMISICLLSIMYYKATNSFSILVFTIPLIGSILGFLKYNTYPASVFMGDGGSNWLGFMIGVMLIIVSGGLTLASPTNGIGFMSHFRPISNWPVPFISALLCLAVPVVDTAAVIVLRWKNGLSPMTADKRHFHHTLLKYGLSHSESVIAIYFIAFGIGVAGLLPVTNPDYTLISTVPYVAICLFLVFMGFLYKKSANKVETQKDFGIFDLSDEKADIDSRLKRLLVSWETINRYLIYTIIFAVTFVSAKNDDAVGYMAGLMTLLLGLSGFLSPKNKAGFFESLILALSLTLLIFTNNQSLIYVGIMGKRFDLQLVYNSLFVFLFISSILHVLVVFRKRYLVITPSDFLLVIVPSILLFVPAPYRDGHNLTIICLRSLVLFISLRCLVTRHRKVIKKIRFLTSISLILVFLKSVLDLKIIY